MKTKHQKWSCKVIKTFLKIKSIKGIRRIILPNFCFLTSQKSNISVPKDSNKLSRKETIANGQIREICPFAKVSFRESFWWKWINCKFGLGKVTNLIFWSGKSDENAFRWRNFPRRIKTLASSWPSRIYSGYGKKLRVKNWLLKPRLIKTRHFPAR